MSNDNNVTSIVSNDLDVNDDAQDLRVFLAIYPLAILAGVINPFFAAAALIIYTLVTSLSAIFRSFDVIVKIVGLAFASVIFPPLGFVLAGVLIYYFFRRLGFFILNLESVLLGLLLYIVPIIVSVGVGAGLQKASYGLVIFPVMAFVFRIAARYSILMIAKKKGVPVKHVIFVMGIAPLLIISLLLPFIKLDLGVGVVSGASGASGAGDAIGAEALLAGKSSVNPDLHTVHSYVRTAPDGIPENNLSYHGEGKIPPTTNIDSVKAHVRTHADGIVENNLSYAENHTTIPIIPPGEGIEDSDNTVRNVPSENAASGAVTGLLLSLKENGLQNQHAGQDKKIKRKKSRRIAVVLSVFLPGAGQIYVGSVMLGVFILYAELLLGIGIDFISGQTEGRSLLPMLSLSFFVIYIFGILNAAAKADEVSGSTV